VTNLTPREGLAVSTTPLTYVGEGFKDVRLASFIALGISL